MAVRSYDIITVGGGIAASSLAMAMAGRGAKVLVLERERSLTGSCGTACENYAADCRGRHARSGSHFQRSRLAFERSSGCAVLWRMLISIFPLNRLRMPNSLNS